MFRTRKLILTLDTGTNVNEIIEKFNSGSKVEIILNFEDTEENRESLCNLIKSNPFQVGEFEEERPTAIQGKWIIIGLLFGTAGSSAALTMPYLMTKRLRNSKDLPAAFGVPILAEGRNADAGALASGLSILAEKFGMKSMILLGYDGGAAKKMMLKMKENWPKESIPSFWNLPTTASINHIPLPMP